MTATARPIVAALTNNLTDETAPLSPLDAEEREIARLRAQAQARPVALDERDRAYRVARAREALRAYLTAIEACAAWNGQQGYGAGGQGVDVYKAWN